MRPAVVLRASPLLLLLLAVLGPAAEAALPQMRGSSLQPGRALRRVAAVHETEVGGAASAEHDDEESAAAAELALRGAPAASTAPLLRTRGGGGGAALRTTLFGQTPISSMACVALMALTLTSFLHSRGAAAAVATGAAAAAADHSYKLGIAYSMVALVGNTAVSALRKILAREPDIGNAQQVGLATAIQGVGAFLFLLVTGKLTPPPSHFWMAAIFSSCGNALVKTLETKAFAESEMSLCAPFLAFDPVVQFIVGVAVVPLTCKWFGAGCSELKDKVPLYHFLSVVSIASGAFTLGRASKKKAAATAAVVGGEAAAAAAAPHAVEVHYLGPLPVGSWLILFNCVIYGITFRLDKAAVQAAGTQLYYMYGRLIMAATTLMGSRAAGQLTRRSFAAFTTKPRVLVLLLSICVADAIYMLSLYKAVSLISPVYVSAIKRGGGVLVSSLLGALLFREPARGREVPILTIIAGVVLLCIK